MEPDSNLTSNTSYVPLYKYFPFSEPLFFSWKMTTVMIGSHFICIDFLSFFFPFFSLIYVYWFDFVRFQLWPTGSLISVEACRNFSCSMWGLVPWSGLEPGPPALGAWNLSYLITRQVPILAFLFLKQAKFIPTYKPLQMLCPLPGTFFPELILWLCLPLFKGNLLGEGFPGSSL